MPKLRQDPTTKEWVIFATERAKRPDEFIRRTSSLKKETQVLSCPFCPGNEALTPPDILRLPEGAKQDWSVRVVPNKFGALFPGKTSGQKFVFRKSDGLDLKRD